MTGGVGTDLSKWPNIGFRHSMKRWVSGVTPLIAEPVILRVVRSIEGVKKDLETSDGRLLREITYDHVG